MTQQICLDENGNALDPQDAPLMEKILELGEKYPVMRVVAALSAAAGYYATVCDAEDTETFLLRQKVLDTLRELL